MLRAKFGGLVSLLLAVSVLLPACTTATPPVIEVQKVVTSVVETQKDVPVVQTSIVTKEKVVQATVTPAPVVTGPKTLHLYWGPGDIPTIDPALGEDVISFQQIDETTVGLLRQDETNGQLKPGLATKWDVSGDGLSYTFHLRNDVPWVKYDGKQVTKIQDCNQKDRMVTADDFVYGVLRTLKPDTASPYAYVLNFAITGADDFNTGKITDTAKVGVQAVDPQTLKITVKEPAVYNLNILSLWPAHAQPKWIIEGDDCTTGGNKWTETGFFEGYGPYTLKEWVHDSNLTLIKNPFWPGSDAVPVAKIEIINYRTLDASGGFAEFEAGSMDVAASVPQGDMDRVRSDPKLKGMLEQTPGAGIEFLSFNTKKAPTDDVRVRLALSMAIDRKAITEQVNQGAGVPAQWFCQPGNAACPTLAKYPDLGVKFDPEKAKQLMADYLKEKGTTADKLQLAFMFNTSESNRKRVEAIQAMWKQTLGVTAQLSNQETKVYYVARKQGNENVYRSSWVQDYPDANNFDREVFGKGGAYSEVVKWQNDKFDALCAQAANESDAAKRMDLYAEAEKILVSDEAAIAPLYYYSSPALYKPNVKHPQSVTGYDYFEKWDLTQ